jgi:putative transposase
MLQRMARLPRFFVPDLPLHVIQRGNDRAPIFGGRDDLQFFRECLAHAARDQAVAIHAYVPMTNHVHLLVTPSRAASMPKMMQSIGRICVQYFNATCRRTGTRGEDRYRASIVDDENCLLTCMRYIELNPVRAGIVASPGEFAWSSFRANACGTKDDLVVAHPIYRRLGHSREGCRAADRELFRSAVIESGLCNIRDATQHAWALGNDVFRRRIAALSRRPERLPKGRPRRKQPPPGESRV